MTSRLVQLFVPFNKKAGLPLFSLITISLVNMFSMQCQKYDVNEVIFVYTRRILGLLVLLVMPSCC